MRRRQVPLNQEEESVLRKLEEDKKQLLVDKLRLEKQELSTKIESLVYLKEQIAKQNSGRAILTKIEGMIENLLDNPDTRLDIPTLLRIHEAFTNAENQAAMGIFSVLKQQVMVQQNNVNMNAKDLPKLVLNQTGQSSSGDPSPSKKEKLSTAKNFIELVDELEQTEFSPEERRERTIEIDSQEVKETKPE